MHTRTDGSFDWHSKYVDPGAQYTLFGHCGHSLNLPRRNHIRVVLNDRSLVHVRMRK